MTSLRRRHTPFVAATAIPSPSGSRHCCSSADHGRHVAFPTIFPLRFRSNCSFPAVSDALPDTDPVPNFRCSKVATAKFTPSCNDPLRFHFRFRFRAKPLNCSPISIYTASSLSSLPTSCTPTMVGFDRSFCPLPPTGRSTLVVRSVFCCHQVADQRWWSSVRRCYQVADPT